MKRKLQQKVMKRWTQEEISKIIDYMTEYGNVEKPTARIYYEGFLQISPIDATWDLIKWKVRHLRTIYTKAEQWINSPESKELDNEHFDYKLKKMCPNYYRLQKIFGEKRAEIVEILDSNSSFGDCYDDLEENTAFTGDIKVFEDYNELTNFPPEEFVETINLANDTHPVVQEQSETTQMSPHSMLVPRVNNVNEQMTSDAQTPEPVPKPIDMITDPILAKKLKKESLRHSLSALSQSQEGRNETQRLRLRFEEYKFEQEFAFIKEKFKAEQELKKQEIELKRMEIESNEKLRIMEMEKNERIAKYELNMKYNGQSRYSSSLHADLC